MSGISFAILLWVLEPLNSSNTSEDLIQLFENKRKLHGIDTYRHISEILRETKSIHKKYFETRPDITDHEQSRRAFKFYGSCYDFIIHMNETPFRKYHLPYTEDDLIAIYKSRRLIVVSNIQTLQRARIERLLKHCLEIILTLFKKLMEPQKIHYCVNDVITTT